MHIDTQGVAHIQCVVGVFNFKKNPHKDLQIEYLALKSE